MSCPTQLAVMRAAHVQREPIAQGMPRSGAALPGERDRCSSLRRKILRHLPRHLDTSKRRHAARRLARKEPFTIQPLAAAAYRAPMVQ
jgi:hypothetical protein